MDLSKFMAAAGELRERFAEAEGQARDARYEGAAGAGLVTVVLSGRFDVISVSIDPKAVEGEGVALLEDLVRAAFNDALQKVQAGLKGQLGAMAGAMGVAS